MQVYVFADHGKGSLARRNKIIVIAVVTSAVSFLIVLLIFAGCARHKVCRKNENHDVMGKIYLPSIFV